MIFILEINLREYTCTTELVKHVINLGQWILVLDSHFVEGLIVNAYPLGDILFRDNYDWCSPRR
jgi:hypothetical protein